MEKVIPAQFPAHTSSASDPHRFRLGHRFPCAFSSFGPKVKMPLALGNEKKNFLGLEKFIIPFKHFDVQSQAKATYWSPKRFFWTTSNLNRNHPRLPRQFLKYTLQQVEAQVSMCLLGKHQPCRARAHETKREPGAYSRLRTHRSTDHTHFWSKREDAFGPGKWKKN